jgi:transcriptional regulator with XRE-family HTH domain
MIASVVDPESLALVSLGRRLRRRRLAAAEPQTRAASRIGVSVPTYRKLEQGDPSAPIGVWVRALRLYGDLSALDELLPESLFDVDERRQRAPRGSASNGGS